MNKFLSLFKKNCPPEYEEVPQAAYNSDQVRVIGVMFSGKAIQFVKNPSLEVQLTAIKNDPFAIQYIKKPSLEVQLTAVQINPFAIQYIASPSKQVQIEAMNVIFKKDGADIARSLFKKIANPCELVKISNYVRQPPIVIA